MKVSRIYVDTSVIGGCCDAEFKEWSLGILSDFEAEKYELLLSIVTDAEIENAPENVREIYERFRTCTSEILGLTTEAIALADAYIQHKILTENYRDDARHIAMATIAGADVLVSWNFKHIVHFEKIRRFNAVNLEMGYKAIQIYSPREVSTHDRQSRGNDPKD